jgi:uncharacterized membrane protein SpoIIM required for sporulation
MTIMQDVNNRLDKNENDIEKIKTQVKTNTTWIVQSTVKLNVLFGVLTFMGITFGGLIITLIWEILTHKITLGF